ncbi:hypothetical protein C1645_745697 [Glomus cerebriforme]|uniref:Galactose oxidase n=1 Tax=Glomus cerebriforme TaxID=658196 RepID=A0A397SBP7_9GLOM|nr:hypothetical protein C1645_745697 [Glomus cerebriforme]
MGYNNLNHHLIFIVLIQLFLFINRDVYGQFNPGPRAGHSANFIGNKIYYIGGFDFGKTNSAKSDVFDFDYQKETWEDLKNQVVNLPRKTEHTASIGGTNKDLIFIIGGIEDDVNLVYQFDTKTNAISVPMIQGKTPPKRAFTSSVSYEGKIYIFGGNNNNDIFFNTLDILDTINLRWNFGSFTNIPLPRNKHTATLVDRVIYYIGGELENGNFVPMDDIYQYDIVLDSWSFKSATLAPGGVPGPRYGHSAVLVKDKICIFGGRSFGSPKESIAMLDTTNLTWTIPQFVNPKLPNLPNLVYHTSTLLEDKYMFVAFGNDTNIPEDAFQLNNNFYIFDFGEFKWYNLTVEETANLTNIIKPSNTSETKGQSALVIGLSVGLALVGLAAIIALSVFYKRKKNQTGKEFGRQDDPGASDGQLPPSQRSTIYHIPTTPQYQEYSILQIPPDRFSSHSSIYTPGSESYPYSPGSESYPYSPGSETPPPPPPKTL